MTSLWLDKHRPTSLGKLTLHHEISGRLEALAQCEDIPHLMFYGPPGAGKKTRVMALLREIFGAGVEKMKLEHRSFKTSTGKVIEIATVGSNYHVECNPSDAGNNDRFVIQEVIKEIASHGNLQSSIGAPGSRSFKILVISEADRLSRQAQAALRRTMEKYSSQCRIILLCNAASKIIDPLRSRCLSLRIPAPAVADLAAVLVGVAKKENITLPPELAMQVAQTSERNLRRALLVTEALAMNVQPATQILPDQSLAVALPDWQVYIARLAREILAEQTPTKLLLARDMMYELLVNCIPASVILQTLLQELLKSMDDSLKSDMVHWAAYYDHRLSQGAKEIFHLEAFVAKVMALYKRWLVELFG